jgi:hypothetical protein
VIEGAENATVEDKQRKIEESGVVAYLVLSSAETGIQFLMEMLHAACIADNSTSGLLRFCHYA